MLHRQNDSEGSCNNSLQEGRGGGGGQLWVSNTFNKQIKKTKNREVICHNKKQDTQTQELTGSSLTEHSTCQRPYVVERMNIVYYMIIWKLQAEPGQTATSCTLPLL